MQSGARYSNRFIRKQQHLHSEPLKWNCPSFGCVSGLGFDEVVTIGSSKGEVNFWAGFYVVLHLPAFVGNEVMVPVQWLACGCWLVTITDELFDESVESRSENCILSNTDVVPDKLESLLSELIFKLKFFKLFYSFGTYSMLLIKIKIFILFDFVWWYEYTIRWFYFLLPLLILVKSLGP